MLTLYQELTKYCQANNIDLPQKNTRLIIGHLVATAFRKDAGKEKVEIPKVESLELSWVNGYPEEFASKMEKILSDFFQNPQPFIEAYQKESAHFKRIKEHKFNFDVADGNAAAFREALERNQLQVYVNKSAKGKTQFRVTFKNPEDLINLGIAFEFIIETNKSAKRLPERIIPETSIKISEKTSEKKRKRIPVAKS